MRPSEIVNSEPLRPSVISSPVGEVPRGNEKINTEVEGLYGHRVKVTCGSVAIDSRKLDCEFEVPFDDDTEADQSMIILYNLKDTTIAQFKDNAKITIEAGYGTDTGLIFAGNISYKVTRRKRPDKTTKIYALDDVSRKNRKIENVSYAANTRASYILKDLAGKVGLPIAAFSVKRDHTYTSAVTVDDDLMGAIDKYARVCGVSAYMCKQKIYIRPLSEGDNLRFTVSEATGLINVEPFEEEETNEDYVDTVKGYEITMLLQHRIQTASIIDLDSVNYKGTFRVREGKHEYDGSSMTTKIKVV